jgi:hypothetical protein
MATPAEKTPAVAPGVPSVGSPTDGDAAFMDTPLASVKVT